MVLHQWKLAIALIALQTQIVVSERVGFKNGEILLDPNPLEVHTYEAWLQVPAYVDMSDVEFITTGDIPFPEENDDLGEGPTSPPTQLGTEGDLGPSTTPPESTKEPIPGDNGKATSTPGDNGAGTSAPSGTAAPSGGNRHLDEGGVTQQVIDIAFFYVPNDCKKYPWGGCILSTLGVGAEDDQRQNGESYCCTEDTASRGVCKSSEIGRLILVEGLFQGERKLVPVPSVTGEIFNLRDNPTFDVDETGNHQMLMVNCDPNGLEVMVLGTMEWSSKRGENIPEKLVDLMYFYAAITGACFVLAVWYWCGMRLYQDSAIPVQRYIFTTILIMFFEFGFSALDFGYWDWKGDRELLLAYTAIALTVLRKGISRCLCVMVAKGWGTVRDTLGGTLAKIFILGLIYSGLVFVQEFLIVVAAYEFQTWSPEEEGEILDVAIVLEPAIFTINLIFIVWTISSLNSTAEYLRNMNQVSKLQRHLRLRCIIWTALIVMLSWVAFVVMNISTGFLAVDKEWILEAAMHVTFFVVLTSVAILWRPNSNAKDYAMQIELPAMGEEENDLELSCVVPSASDMDDGNDPDHPDGLPVDAGVVS